MEFTEQELAEERWLPIVGFDGYEVSDLGRARSYHRSFTPRLVRGSVNTNGYRQLSLERDGKPHRVLLHLAVAAAFNGPCPSGLEGAHDDGNKANNRAANIVYKTHVANCADRVRHGTHGFGERIASAKFTDHTITFLQWLRRDQECRLSDLADWFSVSVSAVSLNCSGKRWTHLSASRAA